MLIKLCILFGSLFSFQTYTIYLAHRHLLQRRLPLCSYVCCGSTRCSSLSLELFLLSMINSLLRSIRCLGENWQGGTFPPPSNVCHKLSLSLLYFNKLCYTKAPSGQGLSLAPDRNPLLLRLKIPAWFTAHSLNLSSWGLVQDPKRRCELSSITSKFG